MPNSQNVWLTHSLVNVNEKFFDILIQLTIWCILHSKPLTTRLPLSYAAVTVSLTHWGRVTHICVSKLTIFGSDNGLPPDRRQAIIWTNAGILLIRTLGTNLSEILGEIHSFSFKKMHLKMSSAKGRLFSLGLNELISINSLAVGDAVILNEWFSNSYQGSIASWAFPGKLPSSSEYQNIPLTDNRLTLVQVMVWWRQATGHYLSQCWSRSMSSYDVTRPQWV